MASSQPIRQRLLRVLGDMPLVKLVGLASERFVTVHALVAIAPDLLVASVKPDERAEFPLFDQLLQHLPRCRLLILSKVHAKFAPFSPRVSCLIDPDDLASIQCEIQKIADAKTAWPSEPVATIPSSRMPYLYDYIQCIDSDPPAATFSNMMQALAERRQKHSGRRHAEIDRAARLQSFVEQLPVMPYVARLDSGGKITYVSPKLEERLGFSREQWCNNPNLRIRQIHPSDRPLVLKAVREAIESRTSYKLDYRMYGRDRKLLWFHDEARVMVDNTGKPCFLDGTMLDITDRKQAQEELQRSHGELQNLINVVESMRIGEQRRLAHEMHDEFGQLLAAMKIELCVLQRHLPQQDSTVLKYINNINDLVDAMITSIRRIIADLPPKTVEDFGLFEGLRSMVGNFKTQHQIACRLQLPDCEPMLETNMATTLYRLVQEALNNVVKHAHASLVDIQIHFDSERGILCVHDNGKGSSADAPRRADAFGLICMRERATALGGTFNFESNPGKGTTLTVVIPLKLNTPPTSQKSDCDVV